MLTVVRESADETLRERIERGEEQALFAAVLHLSAAISADVQANSLRRANARRARAN